VVEDASQVIEGTEVLLVAARSANRHALDGRGPSQHWPN
jgi:hypothetical protein